jgi:hypothetical protein
MALQRFLIANMKSGLVSNPDPWLIMDDAWFRLENMHAWRGKVIKRIGAQEMDTSQAAAVRQLFTRLRIKIGTTDALGDLGFAPIVTVPGVVSNTATQMFSCGTEIYTVKTVGSPATIISTGTGVVTFNTVAPSAGVFTLLGGPALTDVYYYPAFPVMALVSYQQLAQGIEQLVAFDTQFVYAYTRGSGWNVLGPVPPAAGRGLWTGSDAQFHWTTNWRGASGSEFLLFVVNGKSGDKIQYWNGALWTAFTPRYATIMATDYDILTARIVIPFKNRLLLMNTTEETPSGDAQFVNRIRYSQVGDPTDSANSWDEVTVGRGGFLSIPTREQIISAQYLKDRMIIFCERSTWELVFTGNQVFPFRVQQLNIELGVESQNSLVTFDKQVIGFGSTGIHQCNGMNVARIDDQIPDTIFSVLNINEGPQRVNAIRDYYSEEIYWSFTESSFGTKFPNQFLVFNYKTGSWSINYDSITAMGFYQANNSVTWADMTSTWQDGDEQWGDPSDISLFRSIVGGNQQGFTFVMTHNSQKLSLSLSITFISVTQNVITITANNHNLKVGDWINITNVVGLTGINSTAINYRVNTVTNANTFGIILTGVTGAYLGGGTISRVPKIMMQSKQYNFFNDIGRRMHTPRIDFLVDVEGNYTPTPPLNTASISLEFLTSFSSTNGIVEGGEVTGANVGTYTLSLAPQTTQENTQEKLWRSMYPLLEGDVNQLILFNTDAQMADATKTTIDFRLHAMLFHVRPISNFGY